MPLKRIIRAATKPIRRAKAIKRVKASVEAKKTRRFQHAVRQDVYQQRTLKLKKLGNPKKVGPAIARQQRKATVRRKRRK